ncbi:fluoride efflux transporter CrcB [Paenisporosarcina cavernae]|uniref:Fluoride-specific ion channel FluC n=1 Tax=Paenisporosarcina cavernae TaxID=2320858 RepID=A0A385YW14_9BACL|nr:fluoride efflux transporter CrcB [Paenisporosarcina cavernae]AYC30734.1 fluoride efflux transporter CrcB [Paenisporosarcina cavernae]
MSSILLVGLGAFFGANSRYIVSRWISVRWKRSFPLATFLVNVVGSFWLGFLIGNDVRTSVMLLIGTGFLGSFTTFSTFKLESIQLHLKEERKVVLLYTVLSYGVGIPLAYIGYLIAHH